jgi:hypothetical protein
VAAVRGEGLTLGSSNSDSHLDAGAQIAGYGARRRRHMASCSVRCIRAPGTGILYRRSRRGRLVSVGKGALTRLAVPDC